MIEPTDRMINLFNRFGAKLTIFADVAEILKFREYFNQTGDDKYHYQKIENQLKYAIQNGHDVQLHIHSSYIKSFLKNNQWKQHWDEYNLAELSYQRIKEIVSSCKNYLENLLKPIDPQYKCNVFRAANWSMVPSENILRVLQECDFIIDSSVYKWGRRSGRVYYDYSQAYSNLIPWFVDEKDINRSSSDGSILEVPIYTENRYFPAFVTTIRAIRMIRTSIHRHEKYSSPTGEKVQKIKNKKNIILKVLRKFIQRHAWKLDINQATGRMIIHACQRIEKKTKDLKMDVPVVLIGHSKTFFKYNELTLTPFLKFVSKSDKYSFSKYNEIDRDSFRELKE